MSQPIQIHLLSDDDKTPVSNHQKRLRTDLQPTPFLIIDDSPTPQKSLLSASSTPSFVPETPLSDLPKPPAPAIFRCTTKDGGSNLPSGSPASVSAPKFPGVGRLICLESDDEGGGQGRETRWENIGTCSVLREGKDLERTPSFSVNDKWGENGAKSDNVGAEYCLEKNATVLDATSYLDKVVQSNDDDEYKVGLGKESWLQSRLSFSDSDVEHDQSLKFVVEENQWENGTVMAGFDLECLERSPPIVPSTCFPGPINSTETDSRIYLEDCSNQTLAFCDKDHDKENVRQKDEAAAICKPKSRGKANAQNKQNKTEKGENRKRLLEEKKRLMEEKRRKKEEEKLRKEALKAEAVKSRQLEKARQRWEKESDKYILAEIDTKIVQLGSIGGHLLTRFGEKGLRFNVTSNPIEKSIVWRMTAPDEISQISSVRTDIPYVLLIYGHEEFCKVASDGSLMDQISSVRRHYPSYTICCLTNRLMSYINRREQDKYKNWKHASDWQRPPVEEVLAKLTTHFSSVHSRLCADEAELAEHVVGLTINLAKCRFRKKLSPLSVYANGGNIPKDCVDRDLIMKNPWLKALVSIPKVQPRFAIAIFKKYPTMKSLLSVYFDPTKSVHEKEFLLKDLTTESLRGNEDRRLGEICSKRVYRVLMAQNGSIKTDDVENGADYFNPMIDILYF